MTDSRRDAHAPLAEAARACPHTADSIGWNNGRCACGIRWEYREGSASWAPVWFEGRRG